MRRSAPYSWPAALIQSAAMCIIVGAAQLVDGLPVVVVVITAVVGIPIYAAIGHWVSARIWARRIAHQG